MLVNKITLENKSYKDGSPVLHGAVLNTYDSTLMQKVTVSPLVHNQGNVVLEVDSSISNITKKLKFGEVGAHKIKGEVQLNTVLVEGQAVAPAKTWSQITSERDKGTTLKQIITQGFNIPYTFKDGSKMTFQEYLESELLTTIQDSKEICRKNIEDLKKSHGYVSGKMSDELFQAIIEETSKAMTLSSFSVVINFYLTHRINTNGHFILESGATLNEMYVQAEYNVNKAGFKQASSKLASLVVPIQTVDQYKLLLKLVKDITVRYGNGWEPIISESRENAEAFKAYKAHDEEIYNSHYKNS